MAEFVIQTVLFFWSHKPVYDKTSYIHRLRSLLPTLRHVTQHERERERLSVANNKAIGAKRECPVPDSERDHMAQDGSVGIATRYGLESLGIEYR